WVLTHKERLARTRWAWGLGGAALLLAALFVPYAGTIKRPVTLEAGRVGLISAPRPPFLLHRPLHGGGTGRPRAPPPPLDARDFSVSAAGLERRSLAREREAWAAQAAGSPSAAASAEAVGRGLAGEARAWRERAAQAVLRAPFDGRVLTLSQRDRLGERVAAGETLCVVGDMRTLRASFSLPEQDVVDMRAGAPARARLVATPSAVLRGRVAQVEWQPSESKAGRQYRVWLTLSGRDGGKAGQSAVGRISTPPRRAAGHFVRWLTRWLRTDLLV